MKTRKSILALLILLIVTGCSKEIFGSRTPSRIQRREE